MLSDKPLKTSGQLIEHYPVLQQFGDIAEDLFASGLLESVLLQVRILIARAQPILMHNLMTRLVTGWMRERRIRSKPPRRRRFARRYTAEDIVLLAAVDAAHEDLSGPAVRRIMQREYGVFGRLEFARLAGISVSHIYNLRSSTAYRSRRVRIHHTQARRVSIGERRKPDL